MVWMTSVLAAPSVLLPPGVQRARIRSVPSYGSSAGIEAIQAYELSGQRLDDWQKAELIDACGERDDGRWAAFEVALVDPRQNGKDELLLARELAGLFVWGERLIGHSAHLFDTAMEHLERLVSLIEDVPEFSSRVRKVNRSHGSEGVTLKSGARIRFRARTRSGSFRGFTGDCVIFNEAMDLPDALIGSIMPVLSARSTRIPGPQVWYAGSAVDQETMPNGLVLTRLRNAGIAGGNERLAYFEHSASVRDWLLEKGRRFNPDRPEIEQITAEFLADPENWAVANAALGERISHEHVLTEFRSPSMTGRQFGIERLGVGDWPDTSEDGERVISREAWAAIEEPDRSNRIVSVPVFALDADPDQTWASIAVAGKRRDGLFQFAVVAHEAGTDWLVERCKQLKAAHSGSKFVIDTRGSVAEKIDDLKDARIRLIEADTTDYARAYGGFISAVSELRARYPAPQPELDEALDNAARAPMGDAYKWSRKKSVGGADISPLVACTLALWGAERQKRARAINPHAVLAAAASEDS